MRRDGQKDTQKIFWRCTCSCDSGKDVLVRGWNLRNGDTTSCGCVRLESVRQRRVRKPELNSGDVFGRLTVISTEYRRVGLPNRNLMHYRCRCSCPEAKEVFVLRSNLVSGKVKSCGCLLLERACFLPRDVAATRYILRGYKKSAQSRGIDWQISDEFAISLLRDACYYCGKYPKFKTHIKRVQARTEHALSGIDRIDSNLPYIESNCVPCCSLCNYAKRDASREDFIEMCRLVAERHPRKVIQSLHAYSFGQHDLPAHSLGE